MNIKADNNYHPTAAHLEDEAVLPRRDGPHEDRVEDLVVLLRLGRTDVGEPPLEVCRGGE